MTPPRLVILIQDNHVHEIIAEQPIEVIVLDDWLEGGPEERIKYGSPVYINVTPKAGVRVTVQPRSVDRLFRLARAVTRYVRNGGPLRHPLPWEQ